MTAPRRETWVCARCGMVHSAEPAWKEWIRRNPNLDSRRAGISITDTDMWVHQYRDVRDKCGPRAVTHLMLVEVKTFEAKSGFAQRDTLSVVNQMMMALKHMNPQILDERNAWRTLRPWGVYCLRMDADSPANSHSLTWNERQITLSELEKLLRFDIRPDNLLPDVDRRHHVMRQMQFGSLLSGSVKS